MRGSPEQRALGYDQLLAKLSPELRQWWTSTYPDSLKKFLPTVMTPQEQTQRWMCSVIATSIKHQGKGYASAIMDAVYSKAVETGSLIALITTKDINVPIYQHMGMRLRGRGITPSPYGDIDMFCLARTASE
ncbi:uncharacterized protein STEHIDRAFT_162059 [Stereum hirsutum FP-91666 SS1]|uniref:uncharacterized protein n=1 Tax=Stereum hirsutum (strain FP-91666) TaxID=721885 RepID=UPI0004449324|nr:uncharacterized protein STEHIDRAFT_162059 [Stereum hirsutum FP-91666 SS1]EIM81058.1 hypothetical protein STEHIDRAFT_162059 [Stereum hirsutum FP-91666 SS1]